MVLEVTVDSITSMLTAIKAGADRIELCSALNLGGLTPSYGLMKKANEIKKAEEQKYIEIFVMIRPRSGDFLYDDNEFETMKEDISLVKRMEGIDGIVTGILLSDWRIDVTRMRELIEVASPLKVVFHRAFDEARDPIEYVDKLIEMGVCRILTSGQKASAMEGVEFIAELQKRFGDQIDIMPGGGVNAGNIEKIYNITRCTHYHMSGKVSVRSRMEYRKHIQSMNTPESELILERASYDLIKKARDVLDKLEKSGNSDFANNKRV
ncbi:MAG: copper homeostasis protein CutC [Clostridiales bacterium]|jgi:copper homeostasis protein|nr:copper homeostasis protein CutC [Clostridiales bacterium]